MSIRIARNLEKRCRARRYNNIQQHPITFNSIQQHPTTSNNIQQHPTTPNSIQQHPTASNNIQQHPTTSLELQAPQTLWRGMSPSRKGNNQHSKLSMAYRGHTDVTHVGRSEGSFGWSSATSDCGWHGTGAREVSIVVCP